MQLVKVQLILTTHILLGNWTWNNASYWIRLLHVNCKLIVILKIPKRNILIIINNITLICYVTIAVKKCTSIGTDWYLGFNNNVLQFASWYLAKAESAHGVQTLVVVSKKSCRNADWRSLAMEKGEEPGVEEGPIDLSGNDNWLQQRGEHIEKIAQRRCDWLAELRCLRLVRSWGPPPKSADGVIAARLRDCLRMNECKECLPDWTFAWATFGVTECEVKKDKTAWNTRIKHFKCVGYARIYVPPLDPEACPRPGTCIACQR